MLQVNVSRPIRERIDKWDYGSDGRHQSERSLLLVAMKPVSRTAIVTENTPSVRDIMEAFDYVRGDDGVWVPGCDVAAYNRGELTLRVQPGDELPYWVVCDRVTVE